MTTHTPIPGRCQCIAHGPRAMVGGSGDGGVQIACVLQLKDNEVTSS